MSGENMPLIGKLLRRRRHRTTAGYAHLDDRHSVEATERVWNVVAREMGTVSEPAALHATVSCAPVRSSMGWFAILVDECRLGQGRWHPRR